MENELSHEQAAAQWAETRERLARVQENNVAAVDAVQRIVEATYQQAIREERAAWRRLERVAGRGSDVLRKAETQALEKQGEPRV